MKRNGNDPPASDNDATAATRPDRLRQVHAAVPTPPEISTADSAQPDPYTGALFGDRYRVHDRIGEGGMGVVYLAEHEKIGKRVAIKVLPLENCSETLAARFEREAKAASKIGQENIVNVTDFGRTPRGDFFLVMELLDGWDMASELTRNGPIAPARSVAIVRQVARALAAAHEKGIIHRDLKPANLFLDRRRAADTTDDFVKVLDFGLAKVTDGNGRGLTRAGTVMGTAQYMSPEQARGEAADGRADIYALGCVFYEMLTGQMPFRGATFAETLELQLSMTPLAPGRLLPEAGIPPALDALVMKMLQKRPADRYRSMRALDADLESVMTRTMPDVLALELVREARTVAEMPKRAVSSVGEQPVRNRTPLVFALSIAGALAIVAVIVLRPRAQPATTNTPTGVVTHASAPQLPPPVAPTNTEIARTTLHIGSTPPGARVSIDGRGVGVTPLELTVPMGEAVRVSLDKDGYTHKEILLAVNGPMIEDVVLSPASKQHAPHHPATPRTTTTPAASPPATSPTQPSKSNRELKDVFSD